MAYFKKQTGFTVIELTIVVAIIAILSAIAVPAYTGYMKTARMTEAKNNIAALALAEEEFYLENNRYFYKTGTNLQLSNESGGLWTATGTDGVVNFTYTVSGANTSYTITATGTGARVLNEVETYTK